MVLYNSEVEKIIGYQTFHKQVTSLKTFPKSLKNDTHIRSPLKILHQ